MTVAPGMKTAHTAPDISVVMPLHREGRLFLPSLNSVVRAKASAESQGLTVEVLLVLDRADGATTRLARERGTPVGALFVEVGYGDLGLSRNHGIREARGRYVVLMDGDDLMAENWLAAVFSFLELHGDVVVHPEYNVVFGAVNHLWRRHSSTDPACGLGTLLTDNLWDANCAGPREVFLRFPYQETIATGIFGYEDWHFNCETLAAGVEHLVLPETVHFIRRKNQGSVLADINSKKRAIRPSAFFDPERFRALCLKELPPASPQTPVNGRSGGFFSAIDPVLLETDLFDSVYYQGMYSEVVEAGEAPLNHYVRAGARAGMNPGPFFDSAFYLAAYPDVALAGMNPLAHFIRHGKDEGRMPFDPRQPRDCETFAGTRYPAWLLREWRAMHTIEPRLFPSRRLLAALPEYRVPAPLLAGPYLALMEAVPEGVSHVFLVSWLIRGGADMVALHYACLAAEKLGPGRVAVIATRDVASPWRERLPATVAFVAFGELCGALPEDWQEKLLLRLLLQRRPAVLHAINSALGFSIFSRYGAALGQASRLFACAFCWDQSPEGERYGYSVSLPECFDSLDAVFLDNASHKDELVQVFGLDQDRMFVHYQPVDRRLQLAPPKGERRGEEKLQVLWAGRMDFQKRPDLLLMIARSCAAQPLHFHVYGSAALDMDQGWPARLAAEKNITVHGPFDGFSSLPLTKFDLFLNTSSWDGLPNILIEAMAAGLPVLSSAAGGIPELVRNGSSGLLVTPADDVGEYCRHLAALAADRRMLGVLSANGVALVRERHSWEAFSAMVSQHKNYWPE